jgi:hypothetical protein
MRSQVGAMIEGDVAVTGAFEAQKARLLEAYALAHEYRKAFEPLRDTCLQATPQHTCARAHTHLW